MTLNLMLFIYLLSAETQYVKALISIDDLSIHQFIFLKIRIK